jgi:hypothetical protein
MTEQNPPPPPRPTDSPTGVPPTGGPSSVPPVPASYPTPGTTSGYPGPYVGPEPTSDARTMALLSHLLNIAVIVPLLVWLIKKESHPFVDDQGKEALNFSLSALIIHVVCGVTSFLCVPAIISLLLMVAQIVFGIMGAMAANKGQAYRYPVNIRMIK